MFEQSPQQADALQRFAQTHFIGHDAPKRVLNSLPSHALVHEFHALSLMGSEYVAQNRIDYHVHQLLGPAKIKFQTVEQIIF